MLTLAADLDGSIVKEAEVRGDVLLPSPTALQALVESLRDQPLDGARALVQRSPLPPDVRDALIRLLFELEKRQPLA